MTPISVLHTASHWLHLAALAAWIGAMAFFLIVFGPAVRALPPGAGAPALDRGRRSLQALSWIAINVLVLTGAVNFMLRSGPGGIRLDSAYYAILAPKLLLFLAMLFHHCLQAWKYAPDIAALTARAAPDMASWPEPLLSRWRRWFLLLKINVTLGPIVLLLGLALTRS